MMENHQPLKSLCRLKDSVIEYQVTYIKEELVSCGGGHLGDTEIFIPPQCAASDIKEEPFSREAEDLMYSHMYTPTGSIQQYTSTYVKEEPASRDNHPPDQVSSTPKVHTQSTTTRIKEEPVTCDGGDPNIYIHSIHTLQYPSTRVKHELESCDGGHRTSPDCNKPRDPTRRYSFTHIKEELVSSGGRNLSKPNMHPTIDYTFYPSTPIKQEPQSYKVKQLTVTNTYNPAARASLYQTSYIKEDRGMGASPVRYTPTDHIHQPTANIKQEPDSCDEENLTDSMIYTPTQHTLHHLSTHVKEEPVSCDIESSDHCAPSGQARHYLKEEPVSYAGEHLKNMELHTPTEQTQKRPDDEETDSCDEADFTNISAAREQIAADVAVQCVNRGIGPQNNNLDHSQNGNGSVSTCHQSAQPTDFNFKCLECEACFTSKSDFEEHLALHRGKKTHVCSHCGKCFSYQSQLLIHERTHTGEKPFTCSECGKCFNQYVHLAIHLMSHTGEKPYMCSECGKSFNRKTTLTIHQRVHTGEKPFHCSQCGKYFSTSSNLIKHQRVHTGEKPYSCSECGELFVHYTQLIRHQANHSLEKPFSCLECGKSFSQKAQFLKHEKFHKADNAYSCSECNQYFKQYKELLVHQSIHTGQNLFRCQECGKEFDKKWTLVSHQRFHSGEKPFSCSECGKSFGLTSSLAKHQQVHVKEKSYPEGGKPSDREGYLASSSTEETLSCSVCGEQYAENAALVEHLMIHR
ncbi:uncharacterized protein LOC142183331 isoform X2 [Leptodactylus fuscus]|uniref:uncharacterized protein LOC142183331 isoform X2 n=1 Tax=Leptodactylus fuscus TaxID=238119 RepID=UPI003F4E6D1D